MRILVVRNDKLGDFMLAFPAIALLKMNLPQAEITALVPEYTREMAEMCPNIDRVILDTASTLDALTAQLQNYHFDAAVVLHSTARVASALRKAKIPVRLAPATKWFQIFYTHRLAQRRSRSLKPEYEYNTDIARHFLEICGLPSANPPKTPFLYFSETDVIALRHRFLNEQHWGSDTKLVFVHAGSGGSARNLSAEQFINLAKRLLEVPDVRIVFSAGPSEIDYASTLVSALPIEVSALYESREGLKRFALHLTLADVFISGSTGPLHIAGALDRPTAGFYTRRRSATALRWQTLNSPERRLAFSPPEEAEPEDMSRVDIAGAAETIRERFLRDPSSRES